MDQLIAQLKRHEGFKEHVYRCSAGKLTISYGYNLQANPLKLSSVEINFLHTHGISEVEAERLLKWFKDVGQRAVELAEQMRAGAY